MTWWAPLIHVDDVVPLGAPYIGAGSWGGSPVFSQAWWRRHAWSQTRSSSGAMSGVTWRRRNPAELRTWAGRQKRARRTVLVGWDRRARTRALQRGRERAQ